MAEVDDTTDCPVCYEQFDAETYVPRLLPCSHSVCKRCITELLRDKDFLVCPQCRKKQGAETGLQAFPENKYILKLVDFVQRNPNVLQVNEFKLCTTHNRDLSIYCASCKEPICNSCLTKEHRSGHNFIDIQQVERTHLAERLIRLDNYFKRCKGNLVVTTQATEKNYATDLKALRNMKEEQIKKHDSLIATTMNKYADFREKMDARSSVIDKNLKKLSLIKLGEGNLKTTRQQIDSIERLVENSMKEDITCERFEIEGKSLLNTGGQPVEKTVHCKLGKQTTTVEIKTDYGIR